MRHSPTTAAIHIFNLFAEGLDLYSLFPHHTPIDPWLSLSTMFLRIKNKIKQRGTQASDIHCMSEKRKPNCKAVAEPQPCQKCFEILILNKAHLIILRLF